LIIKIGLDIITGGIILGSRQNHAISIIPEFGTAIPLVLKVWHEKRDEINGGHI